ncbi:hypothetical protein CEP51_005611 [Fusarium floridanum]|uniref:Xylanolytic transcriptional activator regulatory domain-containing protein n=1 Tax=Fusarium floridanum TaxID=1325733 RepID=A0A428RW43_9HYPO|nr:hypothetical protein CEP51_005611 [Fusarium floridanum]
MALRSLELDCTTLVSLARNASQNAMASTRHVANVKSAVFNASINNGDFEGLAREYAHKLEERLKRLEESLKPGSSSSTEQVNIGVTGHDDQVEDRSRSPSTLLDPGTQDPTSTAFTQANALTQNMTTLHMSPLERSCITEPSNEIADNLPPGPPPSFLQMHFIEFIRTATRSDTFKMQLFSPQHPHSKVLSRLDDIVQEISEMYPLLDMGHFEELLTPQESDEFVDKAARLAICNASLALGIQWKTANSAFGDLSPAAWAYFKSAFSTVPLLLFQGSSKLAYEAMLIMAMFMLGNADLHIASHLNTSALRAYQMYHQSHSHGDRIQRESQLRVFWSLVNIDIDLAFTIGIPPTISDVSSEDLPAENPSDPAWYLDVPGMDRGINVMRLRAELARIQSAVYHQFLSATARRSSQEDLSIRAEGLDQALERWKAALPLILQPRKDYHPGKDVLPLPVIMLYFIFHDLKVKLQSMVGTNSLDDCITSARATIRLMHCLPTQQFAALWRVLVYPTSAALILLATARNDVVGSKAELSVNGIRELLHFISDMVSRKGCDAGRTLPWFSRFEEVAAGRTRQCSLVEYQEIHKNLSLLFSPDIDYLRLAQSFLGRMAADDAALIQKLSEILEIPWLPADEFGPFVPDSLKPKTHNFAFSFA